MNSILLYNKRQFLDDESILKFSKKVLKNWNRFAPHVGVAPVQQVINYLSGFADFLTDDIERNLRKLLSIFSKNDTLRYEEFYMFCSFFGFEKSVITFAKDLIFNFKFVDWFRPDLDLSNAEALFRKGSMVPWIIILTDNPGQYKLIEYVPDNKIETRYIYFNAIIEKFHTNADADGVQSPLRHFLFNVLRLQPYVTSHFYVLFDHKIVATRTDSGSLDL